jgi:hypothetical protein
LVCRASKILALEAALLDAEARAKDAVEKAGQAATDRDHAVAVKNSVLQQRDEAAARQQHMPPGWGAGPPVDTDAPLNFAPPHVLAALYPSASPQSYFKPLGGFAGVGQHPMPMWPHLPPGAPGLGMLPPPPSGMGLHVGHDAFAAGFPPVFGDFQQDLLHPPPAAPGFGALQPNATAVGAAAPAAPEAAPASSARETAPPLFDERQLVDVFLRAGACACCALTRPPLMCARADAGCCRIRDSQLRLKPTRRWLQTRC